MNFDFTEEQTQLRDSLRHWAEKEYSFETRRQIIGSRLGVSDDAWTGMKDLGLLAFSIPEACGGLNASTMDLLVVMQEFGRSLIIEPYFSTIFGIEFLRLALDQHASLLEGVALQGLKLAPALNERQSRYDLHNILATAELTKEGYLLNGSKIVVLHGAQADWLIVSARTKGGQLDQDGISLFVVSAVAQGITREDYRTFDGMRAANIMLNNVCVPVSSLIGMVDEGWQLLERASDFATCLLCCEAVGVMDAIYVTTLEYLKTREQFGIPIGKFQALQHRMADMFIQLEQARSISILSAAKARSDNAEERRRNVSAAKVRVGMAAKFVGQQSIQLHGGIGMTNELPVSHHFKRLTAIEQTLGDIDHHLNRFVSQPSFSIIV